MKPLTFLDTPGWEYVVDEVSANVFKVNARDAQGRSIEKIGTDPESLMEECHREARNMIERVGPIAFFVRLSENLQKLFAFPPHSASLI
jgi:hypothetical protein